MIELDRLVDAMSSKFFGKYRGEVVDNSDATKRGRIKVRCPAVLGDQEAWAMPCVPYAGDSLGWFALPAPGTSVWVEFEAGEINQPIWAGCFWKDGEIPSGDEVEGVMFIRTPGMTLRVDNQAGEIVIEASGGAKVTFSSSGIKVEAPEVELSGNGGTAKVSPSGFDAMNGAFTVM
jgi:hypothetical protein